MIEEYVDMKVKMKEDIMQQFPLNLEGFDEELQEQLVKVYVKGVLIGLGVINAVNSLREKDLI